MKKSLLLAVVGIAMALGTTEAPDVSAHQIKTLRADVFVDFDRIPGGPDGSATRFRPELRVLNLHSRPVRITCSVMVELVSWNTGEVVRETKIFGPTRIKRFQTKAFEFGPYVADSPRDAAFREHCHKA